MALHGVASFSERFGADDRAFIGAAASGKVYVAVRDTADSDIHIVSLDLDSPDTAGVIEATWTHTASGAGAVACAWDPAAEELHVAAFETDDGGMGTATYTLHMRTFVASTGGWAGAAEVLFTAGDINSHSIGCVWRASDDTLIVIYSDEVFNTMGTDYNRVSYATWTDAGGWSAETALDVGGEVNYNFPLTERFPTSDRTLFAWHNANGVQREWRVLTSADSLQALQTIAHGSGFSQPIVAYVDAGADRITARFGSNDTQNFDSFNDSDTPSTTLGDTTSFGPNSAYLISPDPTNDDIIALGRATGADNDIQGERSSDGGDNFSGSLFTLVDRSVDIGESFSNEGAIYPALEYGGNAYIVGLYNGTNTHFWSYDLGALPAVGAEQSLVMAPIQPH